MTRAPAPERGLALLDMARRPLSRLDAWLNRLYGWRGNPLYHSGVIAAALLAVVTITGIYLLLFYRVGSPYASVQRITEDIWLGSWMRTLHRYASDATVAAALIHALRMWFQRRSWGARALAWLSGVALLFLILVCGWTGYVMVWDVQAELLAREGARWFDVLPLFSEPISRTFDGTRPLPGAFFFLNLFAHVAIPVGVGLVMWIHVARNARPVLMPPRAVAIAVLGALSLAAALLPIGMAAPADLYRTPVEAPYDLWFNAFLPLTRSLSAGAVWILLLGLTAAVCAVPWLQRPRAAARPGPSVVDARSCTGCEQCRLDCPYEAITMVPRTDGRATLLAKVDTSLCTSCGICAGSCAPMGIGPAGRTGKDQLARVKLYLAMHPVKNREVVLVVCGRGAASLGRRVDLDGAPVYTVTCAGNLHTSVVEYLLRSGAGGVLIASCPPRDCWNREGPIWLEQRLFHGREAELQERVDHRRVRLLYAGEAESRLIRTALADFRRDLLALETAPPEPDPDVERECEPTWPVDGVLR